jgi:hypothetical protein
MYREVDMTHDIAFGTKTNDIYSKDDEEFIW